MSRCEQEKPLFRWQSTFSSGFKGRWSTCSFLSEEQTAPSGLLLHVRFGIAHCCLVSFIKKRKGSDHFFFFPTKLLSIDYLLSHSQGAISQSLMSLPTLTFLKQPQSNIGPRKQPLGSLGCCKGQIYSGDPSWRGGYNAPSPFSWLLIIFEVRNLETWNSVKPHFKKHEQRVNFLIFKISS